jgi:hypothetical protein
VKGKKAIDLGVACTSEYGPLRISFESNSSTHFFVSVEDPPIHAVVHRDTINGTRADAARHLVDWAKQYLTDKEENAEYRAWRHSIGRVSYGRSCLVSGTNYAS